MRILPTIATGLLLVGLPSALALRRHPPTAWQSRWDSRRRCGFTAEPSLCTQGSAHWSRDELVAALPRFARFYEERPSMFKTNVNGMDVSHAFSLWFVVTHIKPEWIIESGVYRGFGTWLLRSAAPDAHIVSLDPKSPARKDPSNKTQYFTTNRFVDFGEMDWRSIIPEESRNKTLVVFDDHMSSLRRTREMLSFGLFGHIWCDDNDQDHAYSFNKMCAPPQSKTVDVYDHFNKFEGSIGLAEHTKNLEFLSAHMETYFEFPALFDRCKTAMQRGTGLVKSEAELVALGLPSVVNETYQYAHNFPSYIKLHA